jgi:hypothetical protein
MSSKGGSEHFADHACRPPPHVGEARPVGHEATGERSGEDMLGDACDLARTENSYPVYVPTTPGYWYYCPSAEAYYPYVTYCLESWVPVPVQ